MVLGEPVVCVTHTWRFLWCVYTHLEVPVVLGGSRGVHMVVCVLVHTLGPGEPEVPVMQIRDPWCAYGTRDANKGPVMQIRDPIL